MEPSADSAGTDTDRPPPDTRPGAAAIAAAVIVALALAAGIALLLRPGSWARHGLAIEPAAVTLAVGETVGLRLVNHDADVVAVRLRLRYDPHRIAIETVSPAHAGVLEGGPAINLPPTHGAGVVLLPGTALTGGRVFPAPGPVYHVVIRGLDPGTTFVAAEDVVAVDRESEAHDVAATPVEVTVRAARR